LVKLHHRVSFSTQLEMDAYPSPNAHARMEPYQLTAAVAHLGKTPSHGHYVTVAKDGASKWWLLDDDVIQSVQEETLDSIYGSGESQSKGKHGGCAYILFYINKAHDI
jgi:ubiquitin carboxyl-terminal hydrolase 9/13